MKFSSKVWYRRCHWAIGFSRLYVNALRFCVTICERNHLKRAVTALKQIYLCRMPSSSKIWYDSIEADVKATLTLAKWYICLTGYKSTDWYMESLEMNWATEFLCINVSVNNKFIERLIVLSESPRMPINDVIGISVKLYFSWIIAYAHNNKLYSSDWIMMDNKNCVCRGYTALTCCELRS